METMDTIDKTEIPQLNTSKFIRQVIADMHKTAAAKDMSLDMNLFASTNNGVCHACAGGSAVIWGMNNSDIETRKNSCLWTPEQSLVANWCDNVRTGDLAYCEGHGYPVPYEAQCSWSEDMQWQGETGSVGRREFWAAWNKFAGVWEKYEAGQAVGSATGGEV